MKNLSHEVNEAITANTTIEAISRSINEAEAVKVEAELMDLYLMNNEAIAKGLTETLDSKLRLSRTAELEAVLFSLI